MKDSADNPGSIPEEFLSRMKDQLGYEYEDFLSELHLPPVTGLRVNTLKITPPEFKRISPYRLSSVPWCESGFTCKENYPGERSFAPGKHPYHSAGLYYLQEPSAMAAAEILSPQPGEKILDLAAAPGGKTTQLAALMENTGLLVANEIHPKRVWDLAENLERCGITNAVITNETPDRLADHFGTYFDRVLLDAPCSGEGMFRKSPNARKEWTPAHVLSCASRQAKILEQAAKLVRPDGFLVYTTCTFSIDENEAVIAGFLEKHTEFELQDIHPMPGFQSGRPEWLGLGKEGKLHRTIRIWPHLSSSEGHFVAVLRKNDAGIRPKNIQTHSRHYKSQNFTQVMDAAKLPRSVSDFFRDNLDKVFDWERICIHGSYLYLVPEDSPDLTGLRVIHPGWWLGSIQKGHFRPSHALAMAIKSDEFRQVVSFDKDASALTTYLSGASFPNPGEDGWILMCVDRFPLGWAKRVNGILKNYYPHGLRKYNRD